MYLLEAPERTGPSTAITDTITRIGLCLIMLSLAVPYVSADTISDQAQAAFDSLRTSYDIDQFRDNPDGQAVGWGAGSTLRARVAMYEGNGSWEHIHALSMHADTIFANRSDLLSNPDDLRGQMVKAWVTPNYTQPDDHAWLVHAGNFITSVARAAYLINHDPQLRAVYGHRVPGWINQAEEVVAQFEQLDWTAGPNSGEGYFGGLHPSVYPDLDVLDPDPLPFNMQHAMGSAYVNLYLATGDTGHQAKAQEMIQFYKNRAPEYNSNDGTKFITWDYATYTPTRREDISHGGLTIDFAVRAYRAGLGFSADDIERLANVIRRNSDGALLGYRNYVDGSNGDSRFSPYELSFTAHRWLLLSTIYPDIRQTYHDWYQQNYQTEPVLQMVEAAAYLVETEHGFTAESPATNSVGGDPSFQEVFSGPDLDPRWFKQKSPDPATTDDLILGANGVVVTDIDSSSQGNFWAESRLLRPVYADDDFTVTADITWDSQNSDFQRLMIRLFAEGDDPDTDLPMAEIGFADTTTKLGRILAEAGGSTYDSLESSLPQIGTAELEITRSNNTIDLIWNGNVVLSSSDPSLTANLGLIEIAFGRRMYTSFTTTFGELGVEELTFTRGTTGSPVPEPALLSGIPLMAVLLRYRRT